MPRAFVVFVAGECVAFSIGAWKFVWRVTVGLALGRDVVETVIARKGAEISSF